MKHQIDFRDGAILGFIPKDIESLLVFGTIQSYGTEFFLRRKEGRFRGWVSYTLSRSRAQFDAINNGQSFPTDVDRPHDIAAVGIFDLGKKTTLALKWVYYSGQSVTLPSGKYQIDGQIIDLYKDRNNYRLKDHHRLDVSLTLYTKSRKGRGSSWNFAIYNAYARDNPALVYIDNSSQDRSSVYQVSWFTFIPTVTYNFKI